MNNKILMALAVLIICLSFICQNVNITGYSVYYQGDSFESGGKTIKIVKVSQSNVVFEVDGIKGIVSIGNDKIINGAKIKVIDIFYVAELESRNVDISINILEAGTCGDGVCKAGETSNTCCKDCGCPTDYICKNNECIYSPTHECREHEDCDDNNPDTIDLCLNTRPQVCGHYTVGEEEPPQDYTGDEEEGEGEDDFGEVEDQEIEEKQGFFSKLAMFLKNLFGS